MRQEDRPATSQDPTLGAVLMAQGVVKPQQPVGRAQPLSPGAQGQGQEKGRYFLLPAALFQGGLSSWAEPRVPDLGVCC